jgi:hypothetical protein
MERRKLLVAFACRERLRRLDEAAHALGVFFNVHGISLSLSSLPRRHRSDIFIGYWISAGRIDVPQPATVGAPDRRSGFWQM